MKSSSEGAFHAMGITYVNMIKVKKICIQPRNRKKTNVAKQKGRERNMIYD